jgi:O-antigen/teichoic acid export membrane protein
MGDNTTEALRLKYSRLLGIDRAVFFAITGKIWSSCAGLITTLLIAVFFSPEMQGYYYTFNSVLAIQVFAELGLGTVLTYYASHEWANLALDQNGRVTGDADSLSRLTSLGRFALRWYMATGAAMTLVLVVAGLGFFADSGDRFFSWKAPWIALCGVTGLTLWAMPIWALLEGCNQVSNVYAYRLVQFVATGVAAWTAIYLGAGLWAAPISGMAGLLAMTVTIGRRYSRLVRTILLAQPKGPHLNWRTDILPMQWRIAISWVSGYFTFSLFTPVLFHYQGPIIAGQMGMTWVFVGALMAVASSWIMPKAPRFGILIAQQRYAELDRMFWRMTVVVLCVTAMSAVGIWTLVFLLNQLHHPFATRLLPPSPTAYLLLGTIVVSALLPMATYLRAHKKEPLLGLSVISGILTGIAVVVLGKYYSAEGVAVGYLAVSATVTPFVALIWHRRRAEWHVPGGFPSQSGTEKSGGAASNR